MQCAVIEFARRSGLQEANSIEADPRSSSGYHLSSFRSMNILVEHAVGKYPASQCQTAGHLPLGQEVVEERHRQRHQFNNIYCNLLLSRDEVTTPTES